MAEHGGGDGCRGKCKKVAAKGLRNMRGHLWHDNPVGNENGYIVLHAIHLRAVHHQLLGDVSTYVPVKGDMPYDARTRGFLNAVKWWMTSQSVLRSVQCLEHGTLQERLAVQFSQ